MVWQHGTSWLIILQQKQFGNISIIFIYFKRSYFLSIYNYKECCNKTNKHSSLLRNQIDLSLFLSPEDFL